MNTIIRLFAACILLTRFAVWAESFQEVAAAEDMPLDVRLQFSVEAFSPESGGIVMDAQPDRAVWILIKVCRQPLPDAELNENFSFVSFRVFETPDGYRDIKNEDIKHTRPAESEIDKNPLLRDGRCASMRRDVKKDEVFSVQVVFSLAALGELRQHGIQEIFYFTEIGEEVRPRIQIVGVVYMLSLRETIKTWRLPGKKDT